MTTQADYTADEWNLLVQAPALATLFVIQAASYNRIAIIHKLLAMIAVIGETAPHGPHTELILAVVAAIQAGQVPRQPAVHPHDLVEARRWVLAQCRQVAILLRQKAPQVEAAAFTGWLIRIGWRVTVGTSGIDLGDVREVATQMQSALALEMLSAALTSPFGVGTSVRAA
jgi:hypothetical protein